MFFLPFGNGGKTKYWKVSKAEETITYAFHKRKSAGQSFGMIWAPKQSTSGLLARGQLRTRNLEILIIYTVRHDGPGMQTQQAMFRALK